MKKAKRVLSFLTAAMMLGGIAVPAEPVVQLGAVMTVRAEEETAPDIWDMWREFDVGI